MRQIVALDGRGQGLDAEGSPHAFALPGEEVDADGRVTTGSPDRQTPPCPHYGACGGCRLQHASDPFVADWKAGRVAAALEAAGLAPRIAGVETSPPMSRRRAKLAGKRTRKGAVVGLHGYRDHGIVAVPGCLLFLPSITALIPALERLTVLCGSRKGELALTVTDTPNGADVHVGGGKPADSALRQALAAFAEEHRLARLVIDDEPIVTRLPPVQRFGRADVVPPPAAFLQATREGEAALLAAVRAAVGDARRVLDLFSGCGTFALPLAERAEVHAVETSAPMLAALDRGWRHATGLRRVTTERRDLFREPLIGPELAGFDAVVVDPPRAGARAQVAALAEAMPPRVVMVSCNPDSFALDARRLVQAGYAMGPVTVVDQFRWSPHIELVSAFTAL